MKLLVAYDGSKCSEAALDDLARAGLPDSGEARIISVAETWLPPKNGSGKTGWELAGVRFDPQTIATIKNRYERGEKALGEMATLASHARARLERILPLWRIIKAEAAYGSPAWEILARADEFNADLAVMGPHGRSDIGRFFLGSISQKVLTEAPCSVRIARGHVVNAQAPSRVLIGFDGSIGALSAVEAVAARNWPAGSEIRLVAAAEDTSPPGIRRFISPMTHMVNEINEAECRWIERIADNALKTLQTDDTSATLHILTGNPKEVLISEATRWNADCIFLGANSFCGPVRFLLGSTSAAIAARAHCSVEVVRTSGV